MTATFLVLWGAVCAAQDTRPAVAGAPAPRGPVGADVALTPSDKRRLARRVVVEARTAEAIRSACRLAVRHGAPTVFLPGGRYDLDKEVRVPGGLCLLGEGARTVCRAAGRGVHLFAADGDGVRFTRLKLHGADTTPRTTNNSFGITVGGKQNVRIDHCELLGFSHAATFHDEASAQVDHCRIHHNLRDGLGYGVSVYSGARVLVCDNEFAQNRHSLASNGALDWSSAKRLGRYVHRPGVRKTHWEFLHNRVGGNDLSPYELCAVDAHPGMDGTFVVAYNLFENVRHGVGIRDGAGRIEHNVFRGLRTVTTFRPLIAISIRYGTHNDIPVAGCMPHDIEIRQNVFEVKPGTRYQKHAVGKAENIVIDGKLVGATRTSRRPAPPEIRLVPMDADGRLGVRRRQLAPPQRP